METIVNNIRVMNPGAWSAVDSCNAFDKDQVSD